MHARFTYGGDADLHVQALRNARLEVDSEYRLRFTAVTDASRSVGIQLLDAEDYTSYALETLQLPQGRSEQDMILSTSTVDDADGRLAFRLGGSDTPVKIDDVRLEKIGERIGNGRFDFGTDGWSAYFNSGDTTLSVDDQHASAMLSGPSLRVQPDGTPGKWWDGGVFTQLALAPGTGYTLDLSTAAERSRNLHVQVRDDETIWLDTAYATWSDRFLQRPSQQYINANGGGEMLFVTGFDQTFFGRTENGAVSEGIGYGLVITALMDDRDTFDKIWRFAQTKLNENGAMHWLYDDKGNTVNPAYGLGTVNATDGDLDAAYGLLVAAAKWGGSYADDASELIAAILEVNVTDQNYLTSGDDGYDKVNKRATLNRPLVTSYMSPGYFRMFADFTGNARWDIVAAQGMQQLRNNQADIRARNGGARGGDGLVSFRMLESGKIDPVGDGNIYHADGARTPWRVITDYMWYGTPQALDFTKDFNNFVRREGIDNLVETYNELGHRLGGWGNTQAGWMSGPMASAMLASGDAGERAKAWDVLLNSNDQGYYTSSTRMLGILTAAGWYQNPVTPR